MAEPSIILPASSVAKASAEFKLELAEMIGLDMAGNTLKGDFGGAAGHKLAELDESAARLFLSGCGAKSKKVLTLMVQQKGSFYLSELERAARASTTGLRGVWTGLTKRTRTITGDPDAALIGWKQRGDDYEGWVSPTTRASFRVALGL